MAQKKIGYQLKKTLNGLYHIGRGLSRKGLKDEHNRTDFIHSDATYKTYLQQIGHFVDYCKTINYKYVDEDIDWVVTDYINDMLKAGKSPRTAKTALSAIAKSLHRTTESFDMIDIPKCRRSDITRSRLEVSNDKNINLENHKDLVTFQRCFGLRKDKELAVITSENIIDDGFDLYCRVKGKGGKIRTVKAYGTEEEKAQIREYLKTRPHGSKIFPKIPAAFDAHAIRGEYASRVYHHFERDLSTLKREEKYICRGDMKGKVFDRQALKQTSLMLGHNRLDVVVNNYSYKF